MRKAATILVALMGLAWVGLPAASAQSVDAFVGGTTVSANQSVTANPPIAGGFFPGVGANLWLGPVGIGAEGSWRASRSAAGLRPLFYNVDALFAPVHIARSIWPELMLGVGVQTVSSSNGTIPCRFNCSDFTSAHFMGHAGLAVKAYLTEHIFVRPEVHFYFIHNNTAFGISNAERYGLSLGYSFGGG